ncbi:hypothetical protein N6H18_17530 [Reichenbachiella agarivorans]|uniref:Uncharacterized protein n=1 Tax=Reichenbachiella agarivorans TaxID=2979464 RepID=A0ABY6CNQ5_9BACT|nr:hypothetical protein [Reichenbachiella agarivorans]UXP32146.1 hypothetical protein N6H18_17530 [Reichenbachiella agarivorans]
MSKKLGIAILPVSYFSNINDSNFVINGVEYSVVSYPYTPVLGVPF